jgi:cysteine synthase
MKNILKTIGNTPIIELSRYAPNKNIKIIAKLEGFNPTGSVKDRIAVFMIKEAIKSGLLKQPVEIIEATSGNTGISLAAISNVFGYRFTAVMPDNVSIERRKMIQSYGGKIILTKSGEDLVTAKQIIKQYPNKYFFTDQFNNLNNVKANYLTSGKEIITQVPNISHFIAGIGTSGTLIGVAKRLKEYNSKIKIVGLNPRYQTNIQGLRNLKYYQPTIFNKKNVDQIVNIKDDDADFEMMKDLAKNEGLLVGISSGAVLWETIKLAKEVKKGTIVIIFPDRGDRYLSLL